MTARLLGSDWGTTALGSAFGSREHTNARAWESMRACDEMPAIVSVDHTPTEMVLTRQCADASKLTCHMRINGDLLEHDLLASFDGQLRASVRASLCGDLPDRSWWQATTGVTCGGLGLRTATESPFPPSSPVASRVALWFPPWSITSVPPSAPRASWSRRNARRALMKLSHASSPTLPSAAAQILVAQLDEALTERELLWRNVLSGTADAMQDQPTPSLWHARGITPDDDDGDQEHPLARKRMEIQDIITACVTRAFRTSCFRRTRTRAPGLLTRGLSNSAPRILTTPGCGGSTRTTDPCSSLSSEPVPCAACKTGSLDTGAAHAACCAPGEGTTRSQRGHRTHSHRCPIL